VKDISDMEIRLATEADLPIASDGSAKGVGRTCIEWAFARCSHLRIDTHPDNIIMQRLLEKTGFKRCGIIHVLQDGTPRFAYERSAHGALGRHGAQCAEMSNLTRRHNITPTRGLS
jgi:hypothetical protein